jgi:hypothetical protein
MKSILFLLSILFLFSCSEKKYREGIPIVVHKEYSILPTVCNYTYEGWGKRISFEDKYGKYSIGDTLK